MNIDITNFAREWERPESYWLKSEGQKSDIFTTLLRSVPGRYENDHFGMFTSGSTGSPRLLIGSKERAVRLVKLIHTAQECDEVAETICLLPLSYSFAFVNQLLWAYVMNRSFVPTCGFTKPKLLSRVLDGTNGSMICLVGSQITMLKQFFSDQVFPGVLRVNFAGERFPQEHLEFISTLFPNALIYNNYGCTEAMPRLTVRRSFDNDDATNVGWTLPGVELKSDDQRHLFFRSPYSAVASIGTDGIRTYEKTDWIKTGDIADQQPDKSWCIRGRAVEVFKRHGVKVSLATVIGTLRAVWPGAVCGYSFVDSTNERGWILVLEGNPSASDVRELKLALRENFTRPHWPIRIESMDSLPRLPNGKIDVQALKDAENKKLHWRQRI